MSITAPPPAEASPGIPTLRERIEFLRQVYELRQAISKKYGWPCVSMDFFFYRKADRVFMKWLRDIVGQELYFFGRVAPYQAFKITEEVVHRFHGSKFDAHVFIIPKDTPGDHSLILRPLVEAMMRQNEMEDG